MALAEKWPSGALTATALLVGCGGSFHLGYQIVLTNPAQDAFVAFVGDSFARRYGRWAHRETLDAAWSVIVAILFVGGIVGSLLLRVLADRVGRKRALMLAFGCIALSALASVVSYFVSSIELYALSRLTMGISMTVALGVSGIYLSECTFVQVGLVAGSVLGMPAVLGARSVWWLLYALEAAVAAVVLGLMAFVHESPGFLLQRGEEASAVRSLRFFYGCTPLEADAHLVELRKSIRGNRAPMSLVEAVRRHGTRRPTLVGSMTAVAMAFSGVAVINAFAVEILRSTGLTVSQAALANVGLSSLTLVGVVFSALIIDRCGRKPLLQICCTLIMFVNIAIAALMYAYSVHPRTWIGVSLLAAIGVFMVAFTIGPGPLCYFITSEMVAQHARGAAQGWTSLVQMVCRSLILMAYLPLKNGVGAPLAYLILFVAPMAFCVVFFYYQLPETKNRNLLEVEAEVARLPQLPCCSSRRTYDARRDVAGPPAKDAF